MFVGLGARGLATSPMSTRRHTQGLPATSVVVADAHQPVRRAVRLTLERRGFAVVAEAATADEAVATALDLRPAVCVVDIAIPGGGIRAARAISQVAPETAIVMLTTSVSAPDLLAALRAGASGYLPTSTCADRLPFALRAVLAGEAAVPRALTTAVVDELREGARARRPLRERRRRRFTDREWQVAWLLREGLTTGEIADRLAVSDVTVRRHISGVLHKLGAPSRAEALLMLARVELDAPG
jgi:DNA-binding NarL/FixJ family response regulator